MPVVIEERIEYKERERACHALYLNRLDYFAW